MPPFDELLQVRATLCALPIGCISFRHDAPLRSVADGPAPSPRAVQLWDFLLAFGPHLNVLCVVAQVVMMRHKLLATNRC